MLFQPTNIIPDLKSGIGLGVIDATSAMKVSWQVNGDYPVMTGMEISIYLNDEDSTQMYTTGHVTFGTPFYGTNALGEPQYYSYTISADDLEDAGIENGDEYKLIITQYFMDGEMGASVTQSSASVFITRAAPSFALSAVPATITSSAYTFSVNYSQEQGDTLDWIRYQIAQASDTDNPIYDSGNIYGAAIFTSTYSGFRSGYNYSFRATGQTSSGVLLNTGWTTFTVSYAVSPTMGDVVVETEKDVNGVVIDWSNLSTVSGQTGWTILREQDGSGVVVKVATVATTVRRIVDYGAASGQGPYDYLIIANNSAGQFVGTPVRSGGVNPVFYRWTLLNCAENTDGTYSVMEQYHFRFNMESGAVSNNNSPNVMQNFTANPTVQPAPQNYRTGTLRALIGNVVSGRYSDDLSTRKALMALSTAENPMFLKSSKGDVMRVRLNGNVTAAITEKTQSLAQTVSLPWIALDDAEHEAIFAVSSQPEAR